MSSVKVSAGAARLAADPALRAGPSAGGSRRHIAGMGLMLFLAATLVL